MLLTELYELRAQITELALNHEEAKDCRQKIDAIVNNECYVTYWDGKKSRRFLMKEACK